MARVESHYIDQNNDAGWTFQSETTSEMENKETVLLRRSEWFFFPTSQTSDFASCHMATLQLLVTVAKTVTCFLRLTCQRGEILWRVLSVSVLRPKRFKAWARRGKAMLVSLLTVWLHNRNVFYVVCIGLAARVGTCRTHLMAKHL